MPLYEYKARGPAGKVITDRMEAEEPRAVAAKLRAQQLMLISATEVSSKQKGIPLLGFLKRKPKASTKDLALFCRQFSTMITAGVPVIQGLTVIAEQLENKSLREVLKKVKDDVGQGATLSDALGKYSNVFIPLFINMVKAGEVGGILDTVLQRLSTYLEKADALKRKVKSAMIYPIVVSVIAILVVVFLMVFVIPTFKDVFSSFGKELPLPTKILLAISDFMRKAFLFIFIIVGGGIFGFTRIIKTKAGRAKWDAIALKMPMFGILLKKVAVAKFARTLGTLVKSGVPILQALEIVAKTAGNVVVENTIVKARSSVKEGENISGPLRASGLFPPMVIQMISVGEETGALDDMLLRSAEFYDEEVDTAVEGLTSMLEPLVMAFMGVAIGAIVVAMFFPMFEMGSIAG